MVSANYWLRGIKTYSYRLLWYLTRVSANHASSNWAQISTSRQSFKDFPTHLLNRKERIHVHVHVQARSSLVTRRVLDRIQNITTCFQSVKWYISLHVISVISSGKGINQKLFEI